MEMIFIDNANTSITPNPTSTGGIDRHALRLRGGEADLPAVARAPDGVRL